MSWWDSAASALDSGAVESAVEVGTQAASDDSWWSTALDWGTTAFDWMEDHPTATKVLGGVVGGVGSYMSQKALQDREAGMMREQWERERQAQMISPGKVNNYGSHTNQFAGGLLTGGQVAGYRGLRDRDGGD